MTSNLINQSDTPLDSKVALRALVQCTVTIVESRLDPLALARRLYSNEIISEIVYKRVKDMAARDLVNDPLDNILDHIKDLVKNDASILTAFLNALTNLKRDDLADKIMAIYFR